MRSINGTNKIEEKCQVYILGETGTFYILPQLNGFDGIIGYDFLRAIEAQINTKDRLLFHKKGKERLYHFCCQQVNTIVPNAQEMPHNIQALIQCNSKAFANANRALPFNTRVIATIETTTNAPIYSRNYPYPMSVSGFVNKEISDLLRDGIIQKSYSSYNSPIHVVTKKGLDDDGNQKFRMVIDFRKLNEKTSSDKYPIPNTSLILANLGKSNIFTTLDLKSPDSPLR